MTDLARFMSDEESGAMGMLDEHGRRVATTPAGYKTIEQGAATSVWCAANEQLDGKGGVYCLDADIAKLVPEFDLQGVAQVLTGVLPMR